MTEIEPTASLRALAVGWLTEAWRAERKRYLVEAEQLEGSKS